ncbi:MAG: molybdopterin-dependent oxidoreductase [Clostridia bacterium]|nr:molybdopterin-dependent oxidoreductase [Clostridia bacterium]
MKKKMIVLFALLLAVTAIVAVVHRMTHEAPAGVVLTVNGKSLQIPLTKLDRVAFSGQLVDGKGVVTEHSYRGILLAELLQDAKVSTEGISKVLVTSADQYTAEFQLQEVLETENVYLAIEADGQQIEGIDPGTQGAQLIVFGDANSRRCVRFAAQITLE